MVAISRIVTRVDAQPPSGAQGTTRAFRTETEPSPEANQPDVPSAKGLRQALKEQKDNELALQAASEKEMRHLVASLQETIDKAAKEPYRVGFRHEEATGIPVIEIMDKEGHIVKQFPPEKVLNLQRKMDELSGMVIDEVI